MGRKTTHSLDRQVKDIVRRYHRVLEQSGIPIQELLVFGSHAKGVDQPWSDIDVAVVSPAFGHDCLRERSQLLRLRRRISTSIEPHPFHPDDLHDRWSTLAQEVRKYGIRVE